VRAKWLPDGRRLSLETLDIFSTDTQTSARYHRCGCTRTMVQFCKRSLIRARNCSRRLTFSFRNSSRSRLTMAFLIEGAMRTPQENPKGYESTSLMPLAKQLHGRVLIVYGTYDDNVHPYNEMAFIDALIAAGKKFDMMAYPMRKHGISDEAATQHLYRLMLDFWKENL
jgi:hypothetical protein